MINVFIYGSGLLSFNTRYFALGGHSSRTEPLWVEEMKGFFFPDANGSLTYLTTPPEEYEALNAIDDADDRPYAIGVVITTDGVFQVNRVSDPDSVRRGLKYLMIPLHLQESYALVGTDTTEVSATRMALTWLKHRNQKVSHKNLLAVLTKIYTKNLMRGYKTISVSKYQKLAASKLEAS